jgi:hypothetical protein
MRLFTSHDRIFNEFDAYLRTECGMAPKFIVRLLPVIPRFLQEVCPAGNDDLGKIGQEAVVAGGYCSGSSLIARRQLTIGPTSRTGTRHASAP